MWCIILHFVEKGGNVLKKSALLLIVILMCLSLIGCSAQKEHTITKTDDNTIIWQDKTYVPYCTLYEEKLENELGSIVGNANDRIYQYKDYSTNEWLINAYIVGNYTLDTVLYREVNVTYMPDGLEPDYEY